MDPNRHQEQYVKRMAHRHARRGQRLVAAAVVALLALMGCTAPQERAAPRDAAPDAPGEGAPGAPGGGSAWTTGAKQGVGTSTSLASKVWFTLGQGITHEVYYPQLDVPNVQDLQLIVTDGSSVFHPERDATKQEVKLLDPRALTYQQVNTETSGRYRITKTYVTDPDRPTLLIQVRFEALEGGPYQVYVLYNPSLGNSGKGDTAATERGMLVASDEDRKVASALASSAGFVQLTNGYSGTSSDGWRRLEADKRLTDVFDAASTPGNVVQTGQLAVGADTTVTLALAFGSYRSEAAYNAARSLQIGFDANQANYAQGWHAYLDSLDPAPASVARLGLQTQYQVALMILKAHEDKTFRGAGVASMSIPWGQAKNADDCCEHGYHVVWPRDLYQVATALAAAGDVDAANRTLDYLFTVQQRREDGSFPQNTWLDGTDVFKSQQLDEVAFPIILAWQLGRNDPSMWKRVRLSADYLVANGPTTLQERWEEEGGFSPSTIAAEIAALICAADIAERNGDSAAAERYREKADEWERNVERWTFTTSGNLGNKQYYERIDGDGNPNNCKDLDINNHGGTHRECDVIDAGFLELVRLGVKSPDDPKIAESLPELGDIMVPTPNGAMFRRYNHDGYGEKGDGSPRTEGPGGTGRLWPLLTGELGEYELANGRPADDHLRTMAAAANEGYMIPEQVWDRDEPTNFKFIKGEGTGSATPLAWSMAQFVRLAVSIDKGRPVETPAIVIDHFAKR